MKYNVQIQTTTKCTASCRICPHNTSMLARQNAIMTPEVYTRIWERLIQENIEFEKIPLYMQSEPFTDPMYLERLEYALVHSKGAKVEVSTNCSLMSKKVSEELTRLSNLGNLEMILSFHGSSKEEHHRMMGLPSELCLNNIRYLLEASKNSPLSICIHAFGNKKKIHGFWNCIFRQWKPDKKVRIKVINYTNRASNLKGKYAYEVKDRSMKNCVRLNSWLHFNWKGDMIICCNDYENEVIFGNISDCSIEDLIKKRIETIREKSESEDFICRRCDCRCIGQK